MAGTLLDAATADRLAKLCGMFGSEHLGERAAAAHAADRLIKNCGLSWFDVIGPKLKAASSTRDKIAFALANIASLSMWERGFLYSVNGKRKLSDKQLAVLDEIVAKCRGRAI